MAAVSAVVRITHRFAMGFGVSRALGFEAGA